MKGKPPVTDYDVQLQEERRFGLEVTTRFTGAGTSTSITGQVGGVNYNVQVRATNDEGTSGWSAIGSLPNVDPKLPASPTRSIAENSSGGTNVGTAVSATDPDSSTLYYTLTGYGRGQVRDRRLDWPDNPRGRHLAGLRGEDKRTALR